MAVYLDNSATTPLCKTAKEKIFFACDECWGNPSSLHEMGIGAEALLKDARRAVAKAISADEKDIIFTSGGTESNNLAILGSAHAMARKGKKVITSCIEHHSVLHSFDRLESEGFTVVKIPVNREGVIDLEALEREIDSDTVLVSIMAVNNEVGAIQPIDKIAPIIRRKGSPALIHVDAVQAFGKIPLNVKKLSIDMMSLSSHKIHGPKGVGALFVRTGVRLVPNTLGGGQERNLRPGTEPMVAIAGFYGAVSELTTEKSLENVKALRDGFVERLLTIDGITLNNSENALPYIVNISLQNRPSETVLNYLSDMGIYVSSGSACAKGHKSHVLTAMGLESKVIDSSLRISLSRFTTQEELSACADALEKAFRIIRARG